MEVADKQQHIGIQNAPDGTRTATILCCHCGASFAPSSTGTNICIKCISNQVDITGGITKEGVLEFCKKCERYLRPPWIRAELESKELMDICLKKIRGLNKVKLVDVNFIWTEPHSRRVKLKLTVQQEVMNNTSIQQSFVVEFVINYLQCEDCKKEFTPHKWRAQVQLRQRVDHKRTFFFIEQLILKHNMHEKMLNVEEVHGGIDFFFKERAQAAKMVEFLQTLLPMRVKQSKQLISQNEQNSTYNFKYSFSVEIPKVCKDDLVILKPKLANQLGGCGKLLLCTKVASVIQFIDVINLRVVEMTGPQYFQYESDIMIVPSKENLTEFMVFDVELPESKNQSQSFIGTKFKSSTAMIGRVSDWENFEVKTHLGDVLNEGSSVMAYDMTSINLTGDNDDLAYLGNIPDVIIAKKIYPEKKKNKKKVFKLKHLQKQERNANNLHKGTGQKERDEKDYQDFLNELEEDAELRTHVNMYKDEKAIQELQNQPHDESKTEITTETDASEPRKVHKKKAKKGKAKKTAAKTEEAAEDKEEAKVNNDEEGKTNPQKKDMKIEELLNDLILDDEQEVRVGAKLGEDDGAEEEEEHHEDDGVEITSEQK